MPPRDNVKFLTHEWRTLVYNIVALVIGFTRIVLYFVKMIRHPTNQPINYTTPGLFTFLLYGLQNKALKYVIVNFDKLIP